LEGWTPRLKARGADRFRRDVFPRGSVTLSAKVDATTSETTMSDPHLPVEILDHIVDNLRDTQDTLRTCCLISKSWVQRTRKHLFADINFPTVELLQSWKKTFPDPSTSPARYTKTLSIACARAVTAADAEAGGWIRGFSRVVHFAVASHRPFYDSMISLVPFHGFSPVVKSLRLAFAVPPSTRVINLVLSFPLLEDLAVSIRNATDGNDSDELPATAQPSIPPVFTGSLELSLKDGMEPITRQLLSSPDGINFRKLTLTWIHEGDLSSTTALVEGCSHTLESLDITLDLYGMSSRHLRPYS
jgi:hypothetical protein